MGRGGEEGLEVDTADSLPTNANATNHIISWSWISFWETPIKCCMRIFSNSLIQFGGILYCSCKRSKADGKVGC